MSGEKKNEVIIRAGKAKTRTIKVRLHEITEDPDRYRHRASDDLTEASLEPLTQSVAQEGPQVLVEVFRDGQGRWVVIKGHRRIAVFRLLASKNTPGYSFDMEIEVLEVYDADAQDLLVRSISDNEVRKSLDREHRILAAKKMYDAGVQNSRAARALGISLKTYERDLILARYPWMLQHVQDGSIEATYAVMLLEAGERSERLAELKEDIDLWVADRKREVREREKLLQAQHGKDLSPAERQVKSSLPLHVVRHWLNLLRKKQRFDEEAQWTYPAGIDPRNGVLKISALTLDLNRAPLEQLAKVGSKLSQLSKQLAPHLKKRQVQKSYEKELESADAPYDYEYLNTLGLNETAERLQSSLCHIPEDPFEEETDVEPEPDEVAVTDDGEAEPEPKEVAATDNGEVKVVDTGTPSGDKGAVETQAPSPVEGRNGSPDRSPPVTRPATNAGPSGS